MGIKVDVFSKEKRSEIMALIKGKDTRPEMIVRMLFFASVTHGSFLRQFIRRRTIR